MTTSLQGLDPTLDLLDITVQDIRKKINTENSIFKKVTSIFSWKG